MFLSQDPWYCFNKYLKNEKRAFLPISKITQKTHWRCQQNNWFLYVSCFSEFERNMSGWLLTRLDSVAHNIWGTMENSKWSKHINNDILTNATSREFYDWRWGRVQNEEVLQWRRNAHGYEKREPTTIFCRKNDGPLLLLFLLRLYHVTIHCY
jgi:hypothetical protein